jgi:hypothetical protein
MPAGVRYRDVVPSVVLGVDFARVGQAGFLFDGQCIQLRTQHNGWALSVLEDGYDPGAANVLGHLIAKATQATGQLCRRQDFVGRKFRILMQVEVERVCVGIDSVDLL